MIIFFQYNRIHLQAIFLYFQAATVSGQLIRIQYKGNSFIHGKMVFSQNKHSRKQSLLDMNGHSTVRCISFVHCISKEFQTTKMVTSTVMSIFKKRKL